MINLNTPVEDFPGLPPLNHGQRLLLMGSCFAENIGARLVESKFHVDLNPFGILYNPLSVAAALREALSDKVYTEADLFFYRECWHSPMHHGVFSAATPQEALRNINRRLASLRQEAGRLDWLMLTFGTAYVYEQKETGRVVANCHKQPERMFNRRRLTVEEIVEEYVSLLNDLWRRAPGMNVLFTVSPIRHVRDGLYANQLSKSTLMLAVARLQEMFPQQVFYFPSYEIMLDELRDYRFYADDLVHPSPLAIQYIWERFGRTFFTDATRQLIEECDGIRRALAHEPFRPEAQEYKRFLGQIVLKIERLNGKYPYLDFEKETELCRTRLNQ